MTESGYVDGASGTRLVVMRKLSGDWSRGLDADFLERQVLTDAYSHSRLAEQLVSRDSRAAA